MTSLSWYVWLAIIGVATAGFAIYTKRHTYKVSTLITFYLFATCITWIGEFVALGIFNGYAYKPGVFTDPWAENITGHLWLNSTIWPGAATLMAAYSMRYGWMSIITAFFILAEYIFVKLGIYEQHWWKYYMSVIVVVVFLIVAKQWFVKMNEIRRGITRGVVYYFVGFILLHIPAPVLLLMGKQYYSIQLLDNMVGNMFRSSTIFIFSYHLVEAALVVIFVCLLKKWYWKLVVLGIVLSEQFILAKVNILVLQNGWKVIYTALLYTICVSAFILLEKYSLKPDNEKTGPI